MTHRLPVAVGLLLPHPGITSHPDPYQPSLTSVARAWPFSLGNPFWPALLLALVSHALLIYGLGFKAPRPLPTSPPALDVLVLRQADGEPVVPQRPDALADRAREAQGVEDGKDAASPAKEPPVGQTRNLTGAASADLVPMPSAPSDAMSDSASALSALETSTPPSTDTGASSALETSTAPARAITEETTATLAQNTLLAADHFPADGFQADHLPPEPLQPETISADTTTAPSSDKAPAPTADPLATLASPAVPAPPLSAAAILASRGQELARLNAKLVEDTAAFANRPRRKAISASTQEYKYASYLETWRRKVEAIGNLNYPEEARRRKLYGNLILQVGVRADGSLEEVRVLRSSGSTILDEAAVRIVHLAAPFAPFPPDIRRETDFLDITRTWQFLSNNRFGGKP